MAKLKKTPFSYEDITPWGTTGGDTGLSSRLKLKRNFERIKAWMDALTLDDEIDLEQLDERYLSKVSEDTAQQQIGFLRGLWVKVKGLFGIDADGNATFRTVFAKADKDDLDSGTIKADKSLESPSAVIDEINSTNSHSNTSSDSIDGTGYRLTNNKGDGSGHSYLEIDELMVRYKFIAMALEVRKESFIGGNSHYSPAGSVIYRVDYLAKDHSTLLGYTEFTMPWIGPEQMTLTGDVEMETILSDMALGLRAKIRSELTADDIANLGFFRAYLIADDGTTQTRNMWRVGDQPRCQTYNRAKQGEKKATNQSDAILATYNADDIVSAKDKDGNTVYWRLVDQVGTTTLEDGKLYDYVDFVYEGSTSNPANVALAGSDWPVAGDHIVCMGSRTDPTRMAMISLETVGTDAPAIKMYQGINSFSLENKRTAIISPDDVTMFASQFHLIADNGELIPTKYPRGEWKAGERYHYYDEVIHRGSTWLCIGISVITGGRVDGFHWLDSDGVLWDYSFGKLDLGQIAREGATGRITATNKAATLYRNYTTIEPSDDNEVEGVIWMKTAAKGTEITSEKTDFGTQPDKLTVDNVEVSGGVAIPTVWYDTMALLESELKRNGKKLGDQDNCWLWTRRTVYYSDGRSPVVFHWPVRLGSVVNGSVVDFYVTTEVMSTSDIAALANSAWKPNLSDWTLRGGMYIWIRTTTLYLDGTKTYSYSCTREGNGVAAIEEFFLVAASDTVCPYPVTTTPAASGTTITFQQKDATHPDAWSENRPVYDPATNKIWLWNFELTTMNDGTQMATAPRAIANLSRGIVYIHQWYALSKYDDSTLSANHRFPDDVKVPAENTAEPWATLPGIYGLNIPTGSEATDACVWADEKYSRTPSKELPYQWNLEVVKYNVADASGSFYDVFYHISSRIGPAGASGNFKSRVFCRTNTDIGSSAYIPTGGTYEAPWPGGAQGAAGQPGGIKWYDGIPQGEAKIWSSVRTFRGDGGPDDGWSVPGPESDTANLDVEFSPSLSQPHPSTLRSHPGTAHPSTGIWYDPSDPNFDTYGEMIFRAERKISNGEYVGGWVITRITGEGAFILDLDNEADQFGTDSESKVVSRQVKQAVASIYFGSSVQELTALTAALYYENPNGNDILIGNSSGVASVTADKNTGLVTVTINQGQTIGYDSLYALITATCSRGSKSTRFTLQKVKSGAKGVDPEIYQLALSDKALAFGRDPNGDLTPDSRTLTILVKKTVGSESTIINLPTGYSLKWGWDDSATVVGTAATVTVTKALAADHRQLWVELWKSGADKWDDRETLPITKDGKDGKTPTIAIQEVDGKKVWVIDGEPTDIVAEGKDGTGVEIKGSVQRYNTTAGYTSLQSLTGMSKGDCYVCEDPNVNSRHLFLYLATGSWPNNWKDLGEFKGEPGKSSYMHIAYADEVTLNANGVPTAISTDGVAGKFLKVHDGEEHDWWGFCTDNNQADPTVFTAYKWNYMKGKDGDGYEYVFLRTKTNTQPGLYEGDTDSNGKTNAQDEYLPAVTNYNAAQHSSPRWTDDPYGINKDWRFEWQAIRKRIDGAWGPFAVANNPIHIFYRPPFWSRVYKRVAVGTTPAAPTTGDYDNPVPTSEGWSDGIPAGTDGIVWTTIRKFADDETTVWKTPQIDHDTPDSDIEYAFGQDNDAQPVPPTDANRHGGSGTQIWFDPVLDDGHLPTGKSWSDMVWRAERELLNGQPKPGATWVITRMKGEKGDPGSKVIATERWFRAERTKITPPEVIFNGGVPTNYFKGQDSSWSETVPHLYCVEKQTLEGGSVVWSEPYYYSPWADKGQKGDDALRIETSGPIILTQNGDNLSHLSVTFTVKVKRGTADASSEVSTITATPTNVTISALTKSGNMWSGVLSTISKYQLATSGRYYYYDKGYIEIAVTMTNGETANYSIGVFVNMSGTFSREIEDGIETALANAHVYELNPDGTVKDKEYLYKQVNSAKESITTLESTVDGQNDSISEIRQTADSINLSVGDMRDGYWQLLEDTDFKEAKVNNAETWANMMAWTNIKAAIVGNTNPTGVIDTSAKHAGYNSYRLSSNGTTSRIILQQLLYDANNGVGKIEAGKTYTLSFWARTYNGARALQVGIDETEAVSELDDGTANHSITVIDLTTTWKRYVWTFEIVNDLSEVGGTISLYFKELVSSSSSYHVRICQPRLEEGTVAHGYDETYKGLRGSGINIESGKITVKTDDFEIVNQAGEQTLGLDAGGNLGIKGALLSHRLKLLTGVSSAANVATYAYGLWTADGILRLYEAVSDNVPIRTFANNIKYYGLGGCRLLYDQVYIGAVNSGNKHIKIVLPPPHLFVGQRIVITNDTYGFSNNDIENSYAGSIVLCMDYMQYDSDNVTASGVSLIGTEAWFEGDTGNNPETNPVNGKPYFLPPWNQGEDKRGVCGIWKGGITSGAPGNGNVFAVEVEDEIAISSYKWLELTAVKGEFEDKYKGTANWQETMKYNAYWMVTRWEK